jgi:thiol:disulfide interchange protein DsbA
MTIRKFLTTALLMLAVQVSWASELVSQFVEGTHYEVLPVSVEPRDPSKVEVVEMFSYACIHCFNFDPMIDAWAARQPEYVDFHRMPAVFNNDWELLAQAFYTAETLGVTEKVHMALFSGIHEQNQDLRQQKLLQPIFEDLAAVSEADFNTAYQSFSVRSRVQQAKAKMRAYRITGVPTLIVHGKYRIDGRMAGGNAQMLQVADYLVARERAAMSADGK